MRPAVYRQDFPIEIQGVFVLPKVGFVKCEEKKKCRAYDPIYSYWWKCLDKFEEADDQELSSRYQRELTDREIKKKI